MIRENKEVGLELNTFIFDLDGTLLPMPDQELFLDTYFSALTKKLEKEGLEPQGLMKAIWKSTEAMVKNDGSMTNEERFWQTFCRVFGDEGRKLEPIFDHFYRNEFCEAKNTTSQHPYAKECIRILKEKGYQIVVATNPLFPRIATHTRMGWAGLDPEDFELITTYENSSYCKPNLNYYREILSIIGKTPEQCIMVGNDVKEDMCVAELGMDTYLLKDCIICSEDLDLSQLKQGSFEDLYELIKGLPNLNN